MLALLKQQHTIEEQTEVLQVLALLLLLAVAVVAIGVTVVAKVLCRRVHKFQVSTVVLVVVLVVVYPILLVEALQFSRYPLVQRHTGSRVATQSDAATVTRRVVEEQVELV